MVFMLLPRRPQALIPDLTILLSAIGNFLTKQGIDALAAEGHFIPGAVYCLVRKIPTLLLLEIPDLSENASHE